MITYIQKWMSFAAASAILGLASVPGVAEAQDQKLFTTQTPAILNGRDGINYELGMKFTATANGQIKAIRFYKSPSEQGTHIGRIWSSSGQLLARVTFANETASGWQQQALASPLNISANTQYTVSVNTPNQYYVATNSGLAAQVSSANLRSVVGSNGVFGRVGVRPTSSWQNSNYFRDVVFAPNAPTPPPPTSGAVWSNLAFTQQSGQFRVEFNAVPSLSTQDTVIGLSSAAAAKYDDLAAIVRFGANGVIDARNGGVYAAARVVSNQAGRSYRVRMMVDVAAKKYSVFVTPQGEAEVALGENFAFRSSQSAVGSLANRAKFNELGDVAISNFSVTAVAAPPPPPPSELPPTQPTGTPQYPNLLSNYRYRPTFRVAGVDYAVGVPAGVTLKSPSTISMAGVNVNATNRSITITGANVTLDGYDFYNWSVYTTAANTRILRSRFNGTNLSGTQQASVAGSQSSSNLYIGYCSIDGLVGGGRAAFLVEMQGPGLTVEYSWLKNSNADLIGRHGVSGGDIRIEHNLMEQAGMGGAGTHGDYLQVYGPSINGTYINYNTAIQKGGITQGFIADNTRYGEMGNNVMMGDVSYWMSVSGPGTSMSTFTAPFTIHDNYYDLSQALGFNYPVAKPGDSSQYTIFKSNVNMVSGGILQD